MFAGNQESNLDTIRKRGPYPFMFRTTAIVLLFVLAVGQVRFLFNPRPK